MINNEAKSVQYVNIYLLIDIEYVPKKWKKNYVCQQCVLFFLPTKTA